MILGSSYRDRFIVNRSFRFLAPSIKNPNEIFKQADYDLETSFFSTAVGDNRYINPLPGFGFNTDPSPAIIGDGVKNDMGNLGRYYKRIYDDNASVLTLVAGVPEFSGVLRFLINMFDYAASLVTNKGRAPTALFYISEAISSIAFFPFQLFGVGMNFLAFLSDAPKNHWYTVKPAMGMYVAAAQGIFNDLMISAGYTLTVLDSSAPLQGNDKRGAAGYNTGTISGYPAKTETDAKEKNIEYLKGLFPDAINNDGTIDITTIMNRGARKTRYFLKCIKDLDDQIGDKETMTVEQKDSMIEGVLNKLMQDPDFINGKAGPAAGKRTEYYLNKELNTVGKYRGDEEISAPELLSSYFDPIVANSIVPPEEEYGAASSGLSYSKSQEKVNQIINSQKTGGNTNTKLQGSIPTDTINVNKPPSFDGYISTIYELVNDGFMGGMDAISFRVEGATGPISDSFSNTTQQSEIAGYFNGTVSAVNNFKFNIGGGATGNAFLDGILDRFKDTAAGLASGSVIGNVPLALMGNSRIIIPEHWADSQTNLHTESYEIFCDAFYAHPYSIATQIFLPLSLICPFFLPAATGGGTYTSPFMCKVFSQGRTIIKTGIIKNASITFGEGELGWTRDHKPLNMRIRLEFADLDPILAAPVSRLNSPLEIANITRLSGKYMGDIGKYNDWLARTTGQDYLDSVLKYNRINRAITRAKTDVVNMFSPSRIAGAVNDSIIGDVARIFTGRPLQR